MERLVEVLMRLSYLVADYPEIIELDVNPLLATPDDAIALDARIVLDHETVLHPVRPYSHLAIRPYPDEFTKRAKLKDGTVGPAASDQTGRRTDVARSGGKLLARITAFAISLHVQSDDA